MTDLTQMIRWNANFVRGLAQSVLERAKVIRGTLTSSTSAATPQILVNPVKAAAKPRGKKITVKKSAKRPVAKKSKKTRG